MASQFITKTLFINNMTCVNCERKIEQVLSEVQGIVSVTASYTKGTAIVTYNPEVVSIEKICQVLEEEDYHARLEKQMNPQLNNLNTVRNDNIKNNNADQNKNHNQEPTKRGITNLLGITVILFALYIIAKRFGLLGIIYNFPVAKEGMGYGLLFLIGLLTSLHCIAMCGGICLSQCVPKKEETFISKFSALRPSILYNTGRVISYTIIGGIVGAIGSAVSFSGGMKGIVQILAGVFMVIMGLNMMNIFPWLRKLQPRMPKILANKVYAQRKSNSPFYIGLLNGLMPCGPLQAMQLYALSTGSPIKGAISMFLFSIGTVPLMFAFGALSSFLSKKFTAKMLSISAVLVVILGIFMFGNGINLSGITLPSISATASTNTSAESSIAAIQGNEQIVTSGLTTSSYDPIIVQKGIPVKWTIKAESGDISGCNNTIVIQKYNIQKKLETGDNVIEFTPTESGTVPFSCWMGMVRSKITVVDDLNKIDSNTINNAANVPSSGGSCCGGGVSSGGNCCGGAANGSGSNSQGSTSSGSSGYNNLLLPKVSTDNVAVAEIQADGTQSVEINYDKNGLSSAVIVVQKGIKTGWNIKADVKSSISDLIFPYYNATLAVKQGDNAIGFTPDKDFYFYSSDGSITGYVKVVDDIKKIDIPTIKKEVSEFTPQ